MSRRFLPTYYKNPQAHQTIIDRVHFQKLAEYDSEFEHTAIFRSIDPKNW